MKEMNTYKFDGNWEFELELDAINQFKFKRKDKLTRFIIRDFQTDENEPFVEQVKCISYFLNNQTNIFESIVNQIWEEWPQLEEKYEFQEWEDFPIKKKEDLVFVDVVYQKINHFVMALTKELIMTKIGI